MRRIASNAASLLTLLLMAAAISACAAGCASASQKAQDRAVLENRNVHAANDRVQADTDNLLTAVHNARTWLASLRVKLDAYLADPAHNPAPTPRETRDAIDRADSQLAPADALGQSIKKQSAAGVASADAQKAADDQAIKAATDEQRKADEHTGAWIVGAAVAMLVFLAVERSTNFTFLVALVPAAIAGALAYVLFGRVVGWIVGVWDVARWILLAGGAVTGIAYIVKRHGVGGVLALFRNVELSAKTDATTPTPGKAV